MPLFLSLWGKANVLKMTCVPKFNCMLQALPIKIPHKYFKQFDKLCNRFLWNGKHPRLILQKLQRPVDQGRLGIPNLLLYYYAFGLRRLTHWSLPPERAPPWLYIKSTLCDALPPLHFVTATSPRETQTHPILANMQWIWKRISIKLKFNLHLNLSASIWLNPKLKIDKKPFLWKEWVEKGIILLGDLYEDGTVKSFTEQKQQYGLSQCQIWSYFQIRHLLTQTYGSASITPPSSDVLSKVIKVFGTGHEASKYYRLLLKNFISNTSGLKSAWETDINLTFTDEEWENILKNCKKMSRELRTRLVQFKIIEYIGPLQSYIGQN